MIVWANIRSVCSAAAVILSLASFFACPPAVATEPKRVLMLHSFGPDVKPWSDYSRSIRTELRRQSPWPLDLHEHSLVTVRSSDEDPEAPFVDYLGALFAKQRLDLIVSIGAPAAGFVQRYRQRLFPTTPMLFAVVDQRRVQYSVLTANDAVVAVAIDYLRAFENILRVLPETNHVAVIVGASPIERYWKEEIGREVKPLSNRIALTWTNDLSFEDILKHLAALPPKSAIFWELMVVDAAGVPHEEGRALARLYDVANAPIFSYTDAFFGREIVGGPHVPVREHGQDVGKVAVRILGGEKAGDIKVAPTGFGTPKFDWREMQRWEISESRLPPGSEILFRPLSAWEQYRWQIILIVLGFVLQAALIAGLVFEDRARRAAQSRSFQLMTELAHRNRIATAGEMSASIAHEVRQPLASIVAFGTAGMRWLSNKTPDLNEAKRALQTVVDEAHRAGDMIANVRAMFRSDAPPKTLVGIDGLVQRVLELADTEIKKRGIKLVMQLDEKSSPEVRGNEVQLQQVVLNVVLNAIEAMSSTTDDDRVLQVTSGVAANGDATVTVEDSGPGIDPNNIDKIFDPFFTTKPHGMGMGLSICKSIIEAHGGTLTAARANGHGAIFRIAIPQHGG